MNSKELAHKIDHTILRPEATAKDFENLCQEARDNGFYAVCVPPQWVAFVKERLQGCSVKIAAAVGFPHGNTLTEVKVREAEKAIDLGADEIDMVIQIGKLRGGDVDGVKTDIDGVMKAAKAKKAGVVVKLILETGILSKAEKLLACRLATEAGADFVKTSTDFHLSGGVTVLDVGLLRENLSKTIGVTASGGISDMTTALAMIGAGATRLGCTASVDLINELEGKKVDSTAAKPNLALNKSDEFKYAWSHFAFHAKQRESMFNYFLVIAAALLTAFTWLVARAEPPLVDDAFWVAVVGAIITFIFIFLDKRNRDLVHRGERVLKKIEKRDFFHDFRLERGPNETTFDGIFLKDTGMDDIRLTEKKLLSWFAAHGFLLQAIEILILLLFGYLAYTNYHKPPQSPSDKQKSEVQTHSPPAPPSPSKSSSVVDQKVPGK